MIAEKIKAADETFVTIGMAEQKEQSTVMEQWWDAGLSIRQENGLSPF